MYQFNYLYKVAKCSSNSKIFYDGSPPVKLVCNFLQVCALIQKMKTILFWAV